MLTRSRLCGSSSVWYSNRVKDRSSISSSTRSPDRRRTEMAKLPFCLCGVRGGDLMQRIESIMAGRRRVELTRAHRAALTPVSYTHLRAHETPEHLVCR